MIEKINFKDEINHHVSVKIDNEIKTLDIREINKLPTYIKLHQSLNTALENDIKVDAVIYYTDEQNTIGIEEQEINIEMEEESDKNDISNTKYVVYKDDNSYQLNIDGSVTITIYNNDDTIYYIKDVPFNKGHIIDSIKNTLSYGNYKMVIQYAGNKYFEPSELIMYFNVEKRLAICESFKEQYFGDMEESLYISGILKDSERQTPVSNCQLYYEIDGNTYDTTTNAKGEFFLSVDVPGPNITHCNLFYENVDIDEPDFEPGDLYEEDAEENFIDYDGNIQSLLDILDGYSDSNYTVDINNDTILDRYENLYFTKDNDYFTIMSEFLEEYNLYLIDGIIEDSKGDIISSDINIIEEESYSSDEYYQDEQFYPDDPDIEQYYPNASYTLTVYSDNDSYYFNQDINIIANKAPTDIIIHSFNPQELVTNILTVVGSGIATYNDTDNDIQYGKVNISLPVLNYNHNTIDIQNGVFETNIDLVEAFSAYNTNDTTELKIYDATNIIMTTIEVSGVSETVKVGSSLSIKAQVKSHENYVKYGALVFNLYKDEEIFYQYVSEVDRTSIGVFNFNTSTVGSYKLHIKYMGMFGYQDSSSEKYDIEVIK